MAKGQQRDSKREAFWRGALARQRQGGLSVRAFCRREKITEPSFYAWRRIVRERDAERAAEQQRPLRRQEHRGRQHSRKRPLAGPAFVPLVVRHEPVPVVDAGITIELPRGRVLRLPTTVTGERLAELVRAVESVVTEGRP